MIRREIPASLSYSPISQHAFRRLGEGDAIEEKPNTSESRRDEATSMAGRKSTYPMTELSDAIAMIKGSLDALPVESVPAPTSAGRVLRVDALSLADVPAFPASTKDGYAVSSLTPPEQRSGPLALRADLASHAAPIGDDAPEPLRPGEAAYVATGARLPPGADAVQMVENAAPAGEDAVRLTKWPEAGADVRSPGSDLQKGAVLIPAGTVLAAADAGLLTMGGVGAVSVTRRVRVGILSSGDELLDAPINPGDLPKGAAYDANRPMLMALVRALPCAKAVDLGSVADKRDATMACVEDALQRVDILVSTGGVSMGERDFIKPVLETLAKVHFGRVNVKPGKPLTFATSGRDWAAVGLPGNPVSAFVCFWLAARHAVWALAGAPKQADAGVVEAVLAHSVKPDRIRPEFQRVTLEVRFAFRILLASFPSLVCISNLLDGISVRNISPFGVG